MDLLDALTKLDLYETLDLMESKEFNNYRPTALRQLSIDVASPQFRANRLTRKQVNSGLEKLRAAQEANILAALADFQSGKLDVEATVAAFVKSSETTFARARLLGYLAAGAPMALEDRDAISVARAVEEESAFFRGFLRSLSDGSGRMPVPQRVALYAKTVDHQFHMGEVVAQPSDTLIYWRLTPAEHCPDCLRLANQSPFTKPGVGENPLRQVPRAGFTKCLSNCKCYLEFRSGYFTDPYAQEEIGYDITTFMGEPVTPEVRATPTYDAVDRQLQDIARQLAYARRMIELAPDTTTRSHYTLMRRTANERLINLQNQTSSRFTARQSVAEIVAPVKSAKNDGWIPVIDRPPSASVVPTKQAVSPSDVTVGRTVGVLDNFAWKVGEVRLVYAGRYEVVLPTGEIVAASAADIDPTIVFVEP